jgi:hypothetical protein
VAGECQVVDSKNHSFSGVAYNDFEMNLLRLSPSQVKISGLLAEEISYAGALVEVESTPCGQLVNTLAEIVVE